MEKIICVGCGFEFESSNEDDMVARLCPACVDGDEESDISYADCDLF
jgi:hypothetical protein